MWSSRVQQLVKEIPGQFDNLINEDNSDTIFQSLKQNLINPQFTKKITTIFSPIILHLVSDIVIESIEKSEDDIPIVILLSNLIPSFSSLEPLIHFYFTHRPAEYSPNKADVRYLRSIFRIRRIIGNTFELKLSSFIELSELGSNAEQNSNNNIELTEESWFYLASIISIIKHSTEEESFALIISRCGQEKATNLFLEENNFDIEHKNLKFENYGPMSYDRGFATSIEGVPFLKSLSQSNISSNLSNSPTSPFARSLALAMLTNKPVLVVGPAGSGKTTLIEQLASIAGSEITSLHLGSAVDAKSLLGGYICGEIPGEFRWLDGPLTAAVRANKRWIVLEQIEEASSEVLTLLSPLLSERRLFVPGRSETIKAGYNIRIFATCVKPLDSSLWTKIQVDFLEEEDLRKVLVNSYPNVSYVIDKLLPSWAACKLSYHELFRCVKRLEVIPINGGVVSHDVYIWMYQIVVDTFTSHLANLKKRLELAKIIGKCWDLNGNEAESYLLNSKPTFVASPFKIGHIELETIGSPEVSKDFAATFTSLHHMESVARSISESEPVLLIGETGTGKTTLVQFIASSIGAELKVINMHHQSDTLDILGGFKPVDLFKLLEPLYGRFLEAFKRTFSQKKNANLLEKIGQQFGMKEWKKFLKTVCDVSTKSESKPELSDSLKNEWRFLKEASMGFMSRTDFLERDFAFSFVEGPLTTAYRTGQWVLLDEVNLAPPETLLALAPIIDGHLELPNGELVPKHPNFRLICCMNPATDVGKVNLPETLKHKFVSIFADETSSENDIKLILSQRGVNINFHQIIFDFYSIARQMSKTVLVDGGGQRVIFSLRALTRAVLYMNKAEPIFGSFRACYDALMLSFVSPLSPESSERLVSVLNSMITPNGFPSQTTKNTKQNKINDESLISSLKAPEKTDYIEVEGFYIKKGPCEIKKRDDFILTNTARKYLKLLAQAVFLGKSPVLLQGPTSSGKTTIVQYLADITGHSFVRINNHEHTDMSEYIGGYATSETGKFEFIDGALVRAIQEGAWVVLDELNLAPSDVLEALNRLLDDNNQLYVAETQTNHIPAPSFHLFATQNPPGTYGGRKQLSRAFRGRFIEIHVDEIPPKELATIITLRTQNKIAKNFAESMVKVFNSLRRQRQFSQIFAGKHAFLTVRDLLRWAFREPDDWISIANEGFALLGERLRTQEERDIVKETIRKNVKIQDQEIKIEDEFQIPDVSDELGIVWTSGMVRTVNLLLKCIKHKEPALLVGETGTGKTTAVQVIAHLLGRKLRILNCHQHTETSDFIGAMRPSRSNTNGKLFEWIDGSLVEAMKEGDIFLMDEISLAQDSALERLNSVLEPGRTLAMAEKPEYEIVTAHENFIFIATMNPGGDYGKRELSASLRNRFTEIWVPSIDSDNDLLEILGANSTQEETKQNLNLFLQFVRYFTGLSKTLVNISLRDVLQWIRFVDLRVRQNFAFLDSYIQGAFMVFIDCVSPPHRKSLIAFLQKQLNQPEIHEISHDFRTINDTLYIGDFELPKGPNYQTETNSVTFVFDAPTTSQNLLRVGRALQMPYPVLIEGPPGVGKTSLVYSLGKLLGFNVVRINLSEHTEMLDLVGSELPLENADSGQFAWRDGAFLSALKNGDWVILDELNLASQSVLEGLNSCLDHRASLFVPELNMEFKCHPMFRIFGCQNPASAGHGRKSLPRSFLNRFTRVYVDELCAKDFEYIIGHSYTSIPLELRQKMIHFIAQLNQLNLDFEFNLRDVFRLCEMINSGISHEKALSLLFIQRLRTPYLRNKVLKMLFDLFGEFDPNPKPFLISKDEFQIGDLRIDRSTATFTPNELIIHPSIVSPLEAVLSCAYMKWPGLIVGSTATGKSSLIRLAAHISGMKLVEFSMNNSVDTTELLGGFEQMDNHRCFEQLRSKIQLNDSQSLHVLESIQTPEELYSLIINDRDYFTAEIIKEAEDLMKRKADPGRFEWVDGLLLQAMRYGWWIIIDNANLCPPAVLDRLNPLCEPGGYLSLNERGLVNDDIEVVVPHENFRLFMTVDPQFGEISRAMRNRSIEIYLPSYLERIQPNKENSDNNDSARLLEEECKDLCGEQGEEFFELMKSCQRSELMHLSAWNLVAYKNFRDQTSVAQLGPDAIHFDIVKCQLTNKQSKMTRSNSSVLALHQTTTSCSEDEENNTNLVIPISSPFKFTPMTDSAILSALYDSLYFVQKGPNKASARFYLGQSRLSDIDTRVVVAQRWPLVLESINILKSSDILSFYADLPLDPLLWPKPQKSLSFSAHFLLLTSNLMPTDINDIESIELRFSLSSLIPQFFSDLIDKIKYSVQSNSVNYQIILILKAIDLFNQKKNDSLPLFRFLRSMLKNAGLAVDISPITSLICPNNSIEASKIRKNLGEPFNFKFEKPFILWERINEHWKRIFNESPLSFSSQAPQITTMLETIILSQNNEATEIVEKLFKQLSNIELKKDQSISFIDQIDLDDYQHREEFRVINLSTTYPFELLQDLSIRSFIYSIIMNASQNHEILIPPDFMIPLDIVALVKSYNKTHNMTDLLSALCELILHIDKEIAHAPSINTILAILQRKATLLQSEHSKRLNEDTYDLLSAIPSINLELVKSGIAGVFNSEVNKLNIEPINYHNFRESLLTFSKSKWMKISALSEVDDSYYHMVVCQLMDIIFKELNEEEKVTEEIIYSRTGNHQSESLNVIGEERSMVQNIHDKSIVKAKYRGNEANQFSKLKSIINRITISETSDFAKSLDESGTSLLLQFPLYRDITVPIVTVMRQLSLAIDYNESMSNNLMPFPFTVDSLLTFLFKENQCPTNWSLTFSLIGRTSQIHPPLKGFQIPRTNPEFHTVQEEEKVARQIEELFNKRKKSELCVYAQHFIESMLNPDQLKSEKLLKMLFKQLKMFDLENTPSSIEADSQYLPLLLYTMTKRYNLTSLSADTSKTINIYQKSSVEDISELLRIVRSVLRTVDGLWERYPNHETLRQIAKSADLILGQEIDAPLINFLDGLETMMSLIREWQHKDRDFGDILYPMVNLANKLLKMRLESWKQIFETRRESMQENTGKDFYMFFCDLIELTIDNVPEFFNKIVNFIELSSIGLFETNLRMIEAFALYSLRYEIGQVVYSLLMNLVYKYRRFIPQIEMYIKSQLYDLQKKMKEYVELQKWDINSDKKHFIRIDKVKVQLNKYCQQHLAILQLQFKQLMDQFALQIANETEIPFINDTNNEELNEKINEIMDSEQLLRSRVYEARRYINTDMDITSSNNEMRNKFAESSFYLFGNKPLYGNDFEKHNKLYGEALVLLEQISILSQQPHDDLIEEANDILGISENLIIQAIKEREKLFVEPFVERDDIKFLIKQIVLILNSFVDLETNQKTHPSNENLQTSINKIDSFTKLQQVPVEDVTNELTQILNFLSHNYVHYSIELFIKKSINILSTLKNPSPPPRNQSVVSKKDEMKQHLTYLRFVVATMKVFIIALKDGYGEKKDENENDEQQKEVEGQDGTGLGEGKGKDDITNEIEDEDQLIGDNVNTNEDQQNEDDVNQDGGFEVEPEFNGAADVAANEEEEQMDDEMGDADTDEAMDSRKAEDDAKEADKEADLDEELNKDSKEEQEMQKDGSNDENDENDENDTNENKEDEDKKDEGEMSLDEQEESNFESDAAQWNENPEEVKLDQDDDRMLNGVSDNEEEESGEGEQEEGFQIEEDVAEEMPPDIEDEPDEMLGLVAPDKSNPDDPENDQADDNKEVTGEGQREEQGEGKDGDGKDDDEENQGGMKDNEEEEEDIEKDELKKIEKELKIVQKKILKGDNLKEGGDGGERDDDADEGIILPAEEAEDHDKLDKPSDEEEDANNDQDEAESNTGDQGREDDASNSKRNQSDGEEDMSESDAGITHIKFEDLPENHIQDDNEDINNASHKREVFTSVKKHSITDAGRSRWEGILAKTRESAADLCEQLRLVLAATVAAKMRGDFRTGKRLNMRKIIPFIASGFRKDKIWMRRVEPDQRNYQVFLAVDDSSSMRDNTGEMALESISLITQALTLLGIGELCVAKFGEQTEIVHPFGEQWNDDSGANLVDSFLFNEEHTNYDELLGTSLAYLETVKKSGSMQLVFIISDAAQMNRKEDVKKLVVQAQLRNLLVVFVLIDSQDTEKRKSVLDTFSFANGKLSHFMDEFPFPFYVLIKDPRKLPERLADALRQWFELANNV